MTLVVDRRQEITGPGLHALIVGVSDYAHLPAGPADLAVGFGMRKLASPALSGYRVYRRLTQLPAGSSFAVPLKTCRLLLAPSAEERAAEPTLAALTVERPTWSAVQDAAIAWRKDASSEPDSITLFYFGGHGMRMGSEGGSMALDDFGTPDRPISQYCAKVSRLRAAMAPTRTRPNIARTQFYFVDACRNLPEQVLGFDALKVPDLLDVELNLLDTRATPTFLASLDGGTALSRRGQETVFCEALLHALEHGAEASEEDPAGGPRRWPVTSITLKRGIDRYLLRKYRDKAPPVDGRGSMMGEPALLHLLQPPKVDIDIEVAPPDIVMPVDEQKPRIALLNSSLALTFDEVLDAQVLTRLVPAGIYRIRVQSPALAEPYESDFVHVNQVLRLPWRIRAGTTGV
jgi:hypothetical protein